MKRLPQILLALALLIAQVVSPALAAPATMEAYVVRTVDGDTIQVQMNGKTERVRMIGVDTPETHHPSKPVQPYGPEAEKFTRDQLTGKTVYLEFDAQQRDHYGRLLAYIWTASPASGDDNDIRANMYNARLLLEGYARLMTVPPNVKYVDHFKVYQKEARDQNRGLWGLPLK